MLKNVVAKLTATPYTRGMSPFAMEVSDKFLPILGTPREKNDVSVTQLRSPRISDHNF